MRKIIIIALILAAKSSFAKSRQTTYQEKKAWAIENCDYWFAKEKKEVPALYNRCVETDISFAPKWTD